MRLLKGISVLTILALLFAMLPATVAEEEIVIDEGTVGEEAVIEVGEAELEDLEEYDGLDLSLESTDLALDGLENIFLISEREEQTEAPVASNASGDFVIDEEGTLVRYGGFAKNVVIPDGVKTIGDSAFSSYTELESVIIPSSVISIDDSAFSGCTALKSINIPDSVTDIGWWAFDGCTALSSIELPDGITNLGGAVFNGCTSLTNIKLPKSMIELKNYCLFSDCDSLDNLDFLSGVEKIDGSLFSGCDGLKKITIPSSVTSIGSNVFGNCKNLESVTIHSGVTFIDRTAFDNSNNVVIRGTAGSTAESYANGVGIPFNAPIVTIDEETSLIYDGVGFFDALILYINQSRTLNTVQKPSDLARKLTWSSSDAGVVAVNQDGMITGISQGMATITAATVDGKGKAAQIKVYVPEPTSIELSYDYWSEDKVITLNQSATISAYKSIPYQYITNNEMPLTWSSSDSSVISIEATKDDQATLKANKPGKATITAATPDGGKASVELKVIRPEPEGVKIDQTGPIKLYVGQKYALSATVSPAEAETKLTWGSWSTDVASVSSEGVVTAVKEGYTEIYVRTDNGYDDYIEIEVLPTPTKITLNRKKATLGVKEQLKLTVTFTPQDVTTPLTWTSSKPKVATVSKKGVVTPKAVGTTVITVRTANGKAAKATITVKAAPKKVTLNKSGTVTLAKGKTLKLKATLPANTASALTWKSSKPRVASVDQNGVVRALKKGAADITVKTFNGRTAKVTVKVK